MTANRKILLVNNDETAAGYLREKLIVQGGYSVALEYSSQAGLGTLEEDSFDVVIAKLGMPDMDSRDFISRIKAKDPDSIIIGFLDEEDPALIEEVSNLGIYDFIYQNTNLEKIFFLIRKGIELRLVTSSHNKLISGLREHNVSLQKQNTLLARRIEESTKNLSRLYEDLRSTYMRTIKVLAQAIDARDHYTHSHSENVARYAVTIAEELNLSAREIERIREACELHDLGKIGVEDNILGKSSELTEKEWEQIKRHPITGAQILEPLTFLDGVIDLVRQHHEHFDGTGYPLGLKGEEILLGARILNLADAYEAMTSARSYRKVPMSKEEAIQEVKNNSGKQFDPKIVEVFLKVVNRL